MDTILRGLPVPELYMQDVVDEHGSERYIVVDGQQRIRSCLEFIDGEYTLNEDDSPEWGAATFDELSSDEKQKYFSYKFVVRTLPEMPEEELRAIFTRLNKNVVALNAQELRHATYWGPFIKFVEREAEQNPFWDDAGIFSTNDVRRMLDVEYISELVVANLHGVQDKKKKLDHYYQLYESAFEAREASERTLFRTTGEILGILPEIRKSRWRKKSDFYSLFLIMSGASERFPLARDEREAVTAKLNELEAQVTEFLKVDLDSVDEVEKWPAHVRKYGVAVERAASDLSNRKARHEVLSFVLGDLIGG
jgi:uncharacterized protein with ParB-like and HNH nuclease domain